MTIRTRSFTVPALGVLLASVVLLLAHRDATAQGMAGAITGYAWSDTIGWVSLSGPGYGLAVAGNGTIAGYAWSDNIGWVSAQASDLVGCPSAPCTARLTGTKLQGWLRALAGGTTQSGGWDGFISLSGPSYGPSRNSHTAMFSGFAWGDTVVGWLDFSFASTLADMCPQTQTYSCAGNVIQFTDEQCAVTQIAICSPPQFCASGVASCLTVPPRTMAFAAFQTFDGRLTARPSIVRTGDSVRLYWNVENAESCTVRGSNGDSWSATFSGVEGVISGPITEHTTYNLHCIAGDNTVPPAVTDSTTVHIAPLFQEI